MTSIAPDIRSILSGMVERKCGRCKEFRRLTQARNQAIGDQEFVCDDCVDKQTQAARREARLNAIRQDLPKSMKMAGVPVIFQQASFDNCPDIPAALVKQTRSWAKQPRGILYLHGQPGSGKSYVAACVLREIIASGILPPERCQYIDEPAFLTAIKATYDGPEARSHREERVPLLVFDDLGSTRWTDWAANTVSELFVRRHNAGLPAIVTSNYSLTEIAQKLCVPRLASRFAEDGQPIGFPKKDLRLSGKVKRPAVDLSAHQEPSGSW